MKRLAGVVLFLFVFMCVAIAEGNLKIGFIDSKEVLKKFKRYQKAYEELDKLRKPMQEELKEKELEIRKMQKDLEEDVLLSDIKLSLIHI